MLEAELVCACDHVVRTAARVKVLFSSSFSVVRVFFPNRFLGLCRHGGATPFLHTFRGGSRAGVTFSEQSLFVIVFRKRFFDVSVSFSYVHVNQFGATFHNAQ